MSRTLHLLFQSVSTALLLSGLFFLCEAVIKYAAIGFKTEHLMNDIILLIFTAITFASVAFALKTIWSTKC